MKYGVREVVDVVLRAKGTMDLGKKRFYKNEPVIYFDTLTTSTLEGAATTVYAQGGKGNARLMAWEGERTVTFTMEDALISPESLSILTGAGLVEASDGTPVYQHVVETTDDYTISGEGENAVLSVKIEKLPFLPKASDIVAKVENEQLTLNENYACVMFTRDGEIVSEPYIVSQAAGDIPTKPGDDGKYTIVVNQHDCNFGANCHEDNAKYYPNDLAVDAAKANGVLVDYYTKITSGAKQIDITADKFAGNFYLEGSTLWKDEQGLDHPAEFIIPNCKIQSNFTFTMASTGDPSTFTFTMDAFPDYTRFDHTQKVFSSIQVIESQTTASATLNGLHRGKTWHASDIAGTEGENLEFDNHD